MEKLDQEYVESTLTRILNRLQNFASTPFIAGPPAAPTGFAFPSSETGTPAYQDTIREIVTAAAHTGHVVIVGRRGQVLFADQRDVLHVRVVVPLEQCVAYTILREGLDAEAARTRVQAKDCARTCYMQTQYRCQHEDAHLYDLVINTAVLDLDSAVDLICLAVEYKASRLSVPVEQLGPEADLAPYLARPADFRVPGQTSN